MNFSRLFILRPIATFLIMLALLLFGLLAYRLLPIASLPEIDYPTIEVVTFYPGASPWVMATGVTAPLERQFGQMPGLMQMSSTSSSTSSIIILQFDLNISLDVAEQQVQAAINASATFMPKDLPNPPIYHKVNPADTPILTFALTSKTFPLIKIQDYADTRLSPKISQSSGVGLVSLSGGYKPAIRISVNADTLSAYGINFEELRQVIANANLNFPKGSFDGPQLSYVINNNDQLLTSEGYRSLIIRYKNNAPTFLADVAKVEIGPQNILQAAWMNQTPAIIMNVLRQPGANVIAVVDKIKQILPKLQANLPAAIQLTLLADRTIPIRASIDEVQFDLILAIALVVMVIFLFLRHLPATFIPSVAVPLSLVGTFGFMYLFGFSINNLTLMALTIATGFVVDDAIVMIENISRYVEGGEPPLTAAIKGAKQIGFTIISLTISLIAVLIPLLFMRDLLGRLFREFAMTLSIAILLSAVVSLTLTPMLCARMLKANAHKKSNVLSEKFANFFQHMLDAYKNSLTAVLQSQFAVLMITLLTLMITFFLFWYIPKGFFPIQDTGMIQGISVASPTISFKEMAKRQQMLTQEILKDPAVQNVSSFIGIDGINTTLNSGRIMIALKPLNERKSGADEFIQRIKLSLQKIPGISLYLQPVQSLTIDNTVSRTQYQYSLSSPLSDEVTVWSKRLFNYLNTENKIRDVTLSDNDNLGLQINVEIDRNTASRLGLSAQYIDDTLYDAFGQRLISTMFTQRSQYYVVLNADNENKTGLDALNNIYIISNTGEKIPLDVFTSVSSRAAPLTINRLNQFPVSTLSFNLGDNVALSDAMRAVENAKDTLNIPESIQTSFEGAAKIFKASLKNEMWLIFASIIVVYIVLGVLYESYIHPLTILSTLPSACIGALLALLLTHQSLTIIALIGILLLIGIVMKNAIMMIDFALERERQYQRSAAEAIFEAAILRFRPIMMTTFASIFGALPLALGTGMGSELRQPLGMVIISGLLLSQLVTLYTTPVVYLFFDRWNIRMRSFHQKFFSKDGT